MPHPLLRHIAQQVPPQYFVLAAFGLLLVVLKLVYPQPYRHNPMSVQYALYMMGIFVVASILGQARKLAHSDDRREGISRAMAMVRDWLPFVLCLWVYENLHDLTMWIRPQTLDHHLARADLWLFGVQPTLWLERVMHPLLTDYMAVAYMTYFVLPFLLSGWLYFRGHVPAFKELQLALLVTFYGGFLGYIIVPAVGPQLILADAYHKPLVGWYFFWTAKRVVTRLQYFPRDCFPSLHTAVSSVTLFFMLRHQRTVPLRHLVAPIWTILTVSLWISTVYLRYHWVVDVFAGWGLTVLSCAAGVLVQRHWPSAPPERENAPAPEVAHV